MSQHLPEIQVLHFKVNTRDAERPPAGARDVVMNYVFRSIRPWMNRLKNPISVHHVDHTMEISVQVLASNASRIRVELESLLSGYGTTSVNEYGHDQSPWSFGHNRSRS